jgi:hypothetical protein
MQKGFAHILILAGGMISIALIGGIFYLKKFSLPLAPAKEANYPIEVIKYPISTVPPDINNWKTYINSDLGISYKYPPDWTVAKSTGDLSAPKDISSEWSDWIGFAVFNNPQNLSLPDLEKEETGLSLMSPNIYLAGDKEVDLPNIGKAYKGECTLDGPSYVECPKYVFKHGSKVYRIVNSIFSAYNLQQKKAIFDQVVLSIRFLDQDPLPDTSSWKTYQYNDEFSFKYPNEWFVEDKESKDNEPIRFFKTGEKSLQTQMMAKGNEMLFVTVQTTQNFDQLATQLNLKTNSISIDGKRTLKYSTGTYILLGPSESRVLSIYRPEYPDQDYLDKILDTFRFLE